jgi:hypothetical protein
MINYDDYTLEELKDLIAKGVFDEKDIRHFYCNDWWDFVDEE